MTEKPVAKLIKVLLIVLIILFHLPATIREPLIAAFPPGGNIIKTAYVGVSLFFISAGFGLQKHYQQFTWSLRSYGDFLRGRLMKLYPLYFFSLIVAAPDAIHKAVQEWSGLGLAFNGLLSFLSAATLTQSLHPRAATFWNGPAWFMSALFLLYVMFPIVNSFASRLTAKGAVIIISVSYCLMVISGLAAGALLSDGYGTIASTAIPTNPLAGIVQYNPLFRIPELVVGCALARCPSIAVSQVCLWLALALVGLCYLGFLGLSSPGMPYCVMYSGLLTPLFATVLILADRLVVPLHLEAIANGLGRLSYSLYLLHAPLAKYFLYWILLLFGLAVPATCVYFVVVLISAYLSVVLSDRFICWIRGQPVTESRLPKRQSTLK